jgi:hypothetical protein
VFLSMTNLAKTCFNVVGVLFLTALVVLEVRKHRCAVLVQRVSAPENPADSLCRNAVSVKGGDCAGLGTSPSQYTLRMTQSIAGHKNRQNDVFEIIRKHALFSRRKSVFAALTRPARPSRATPGA